MTAILTEEAREIIRQDAMWAMGRWASEPFETTLFADELQPAIAVEAELAEHGIAPCTIIVRDDLSVPADRAVTIVHSYRNGDEPAEHSRSYLSQDHLNREWPPAVERVALQRAFDRLAFLVDRKHRNEAPDRRAQLDDLLHDLAEFL